MTQDNKFGHRLLLHPEQIVMFIDYSSELMETLHKLDDNDGFQSPPAAQVLADLLARFHASEGYQKLLKSLLSLSPAEAQELGAIVAVGEKSLKAADFVAACKVESGSKDVLGQAMHLISDVSLSKKIQRGINALTKAGVIAEEF